MTDRLWAAVGIGIVLAIGFARLWRRRSKLCERRDFAAEYTERFQEYVKSEGSDGAAYGWLTHRSQRMQSTLGSDGILHTFQPPYANYAIHNYAVILNMLPQLRQVAEESGGITASRHLFNNYAATVQEVLIRFDGTMEDLIAAARSTLLNPLVWFREGMQLLLLAPFSILESLGIGSGALSARVAGSLIFRALYAVATLVTFVSGVVTILAGVEPAAKALRSIFHH